MSDDELADLRRQLREAQEAHRIVAERLRRYEQSRSARLIGAAWAAERRLRDTAIRQRYRIRRLREETGIESGRPSGADIDSPRPVALPATANAPDVSIIIPVHNRLDITATCLTSIAAATIDYSIEVIVVDDASTDDTAAWLERCSGLRVLRLDDNVGYLRATNRGAAMAVGRLLCLLNNDVVVADHWLDGLVDAIESDERIGAAGAMLVYPSGEVQEAGAIVWSDGTGHNVGRGHGPDHEALQHRREVDYCSAACLIVKSERWFELGGYDERFVPAYYEDTDLAFALRERGFSVVVEPAVRVTHVEGASHGTSTDDGTKAHQIRNREVFVDKWSELLADQPERGGDPLVAGWRGGPFVFVANDRVPTPDIDSASTRLTELLRLLVDRRHRVVFFAADGVEREPYTTRLRQLGVQMVFSPADLDGVLRRSAGNTAAVIGSRPKVADQLFALAAAAGNGADRVYDMVDSHALRLERRAAHERRQLSDAEQHEIGLEAGLVGRADIVIAISTAEANEARSLGAAAVDVLPNIHNVKASTAAFDDRTGLIFVGNYLHEPNRDALLWLRDAVMPLVWTHDPAIRLHVVGGHLPSDFLGAADERIVMHGWVPYLDEMFETVRVNVAPLRYGAGLKGKVGDALARGVPTVATSVAAEGFDADAAGLLVGDSAEEFADHVLRVHRDPQQWNHAVDCGIDYTRTHLSIDSAMATLDRIGL